MTDQNPLSMAEGAVACHEMFLSLCQAGFSEGQALMLVGQMLNAGAKAAGDE